MKLRDLVLIFSLFGCFKSPLADFLDQRGVCYGVAEVINRQINSQELKIDAAKNYFQQCLGTNNHSEIDIESIDYSFEESTRTLFAYCAKEECKKREIARR